MHFYIYIWIRIRYRTVSEWVSVCVSSTRWLWCLYLPYAKQWIIKMTELCALCVCWLFCSFFILFHLLMRRVNFRKTLKVNGRECEMRLKTTELHGVPYRNRYLFIYTMDKVIIRTFLPLANRNRRSTNGRNIGKKAEELANDSNQIFNAGVAKSKRMFILIHYYFLPLKTHRCCSANNLNDYSFLFQILLFGIILVESIHSWVRLLNIVDAFLYGFLIK